MYNYSLNQDFDLFVEELIRVIRDNKVEVLLVSGDIFDYANPSVEAREQYYQTLVKLHATGCKIILTGGNHDSAQMLNAPYELMKMLDIFVVGGLSDCVEDYCIPLYNNGQLEVVVLAVPFLRDMDFRKANEGESYSNRIEIVQEGILNTYRYASRYVREKYGEEVPVIAMGHLYTAGAVASESERDIQIGNQALLEASRFGDDFAYMALGHIHKPQKIQAKFPMYYSGSPIPLSFSERNDEKRLLLLDTEIGFEPINIPLTSHRKLIRVKGDLDSIRAQLASLPERTNLVSLVEVVLVEEVYDAQKNTDLEELIQNFQEEGYIIIHRKISFRRSLQGTKEWEQVGVKCLSELKPQEVFVKLLEQQNFSEQTLSELKELFQLIYEEELD